MRASTSIIIERPIRDVFAFAAEPGCWAEWITGVSAVEKTSAGRYPDVGSTFEQTERITGYRRRSSWQVIEYEPPHVSSCRRLTEPSGIVRQVFESMEDSTRLTLCTEGGTFTGGPKVERAIRAQQERDLDRLKRLLEWVDDPESEKAPPERPETRLPKRGQDEGRGVSREGVGGEGAGDARRKSPLRPAVSGAGDEARLIAGNVVARRGAGFDSLGTEKGAGKMAGITLRRPSEAVKDTRRKKTPPPALLAVALLATLVVLAWGTRTPV